MLRLKLSVDQNQPPPRPSCEPPLRTIPNISGFFTIHIDRAMRLRVNHCDVAVAEERYTHENTLDAASYSLNDEWTSADEASIALYTSPLPACSSPYSPRASK